MKKLAFLALAALALVSCQSNQYKIQGTGEGLAEGDTLFLISDMMLGLPSDTIVVSGGKFELSGETDTTSICGIIYPAKQQQVAFFKEPGNIKIEFLADGNSKISGTLVNDEFQLLLDSAEVYNQRVNEASMAFSDSLTEEQQKSIRDEINKAQEAMGKVFLTSAEKNISNELGYFLVTNYEDEEFNLDKKIELIEKMPAKFQQRDDIKQMKETAEASKKTAIGQPMPEFTLNTPEGTPLNVMDEVKQHKLTILDFWASWCGPCRQEMPFMKELYAKYKDKGLGIVGISLDDDADRWQAAIKELGLAWPQMSDLKGWKCEAGQLFQVNAIPFMAIVNEEGIIVQKGLRGDKLEAFISEQLQ